MRADLAAARRHEGQTFFDIVVEIIHDHGHRDLLVYSAGPYKPLRWLRDTLTSKHAAKDKTLHPWQQAAEAPRYLVDLLCPEGGLVLDPCCGSGTFGAAALASGRRFFGVDVDPTSLAIAAERLRQQGVGTSQQDPTGNVSCAQTRKRRP